MSTVNTKSFSKLLRNKKLLIAGIIVVVLICIPLVLVSFQSNPSYKGNSSSHPGMVNPTTALTVSAQLQPTPILTSVLSFKQESATSTAILIDTGSVAASGVQLSISFDPGILQNVAISPGDFFTNALVLTNKIDSTNGTIFYAAVVPPNGRSRQGKGVVARLSYTFAQGAINPTKLQFLPDTKVSARGVNNSTLKIAGSASISASGK